MRRTREKKQQKGGKRRKCVGNKLEGRKVNIVQIHTNRIRKGSRGGGYISKIIKQSCFNRKWGRGGGEGDFWYGLAIYRHNIFIWRTSCI
jgi:hypothetical protein